MSLMQGHSAAVKEAVGSSLLGCKAPFRLMQDHSRSGRLEASTLALRKWLFSEHFERYLSLLQVGARHPCFWFCSHLLLVLQSLKFVHKPETYHACSGMLCTG